MPADGLEQIRNHDAKPAVPPVHHLRPLWVMPGIASPLANRHPGDIDFLDLRESNEGGRVVELANREAIEFERVDRKASAAMVEKDHPAKRLSRRTSRRSHHDAQTAARRTGYARHRWRPPLSTNT